MPLFISALLGGLIQIVGTLVGRVLVSLGIGFATYTGVSASISWARDQAFAHISALSPAVIQFVGVLQIGTCISILTSAYAARLVLAGLTSGALTKMVQR